MEPVEWCLLYMNDGLCLPSSEWASWTQALVSVAAILAGAIAVWWQVRRTERYRLAEAHLQAAEKARHLMAFFIPLHQIADDALRAFENYRDAEVFLAGSLLDAQIFLVREAFARVDVSFFLNAEHMLYFVATQASSEEFLKVLERDRMLILGAYSPGLLEALHRKLKGFKEQLSKFDQVAQSWVNESSDKAHRVLGSSKH